MPVFTSNETTCRRCAVRCDMVVYLSGCIDGSCPSLYVNEREGRRYLGCLNGVFAVEIDRAAFLEMQATRVGFGALRAVRPPQPQCRTDVDQAFAHRTGRACVNPDFLLSGSYRRIRVTVSGPDDDPPHPG